MTTETVLRDKLATCTRIFAMQEMIGLFGHISAYDPSTQRVYLSPGMGAEKSMVAAGDIMVSDLDGRILEGGERLAAEWPIHTVLHGSRSDALAVAHLHAPYSTLFSISERPFRPVTLQGSIFDGEIPLYTEPQLVRSIAQGRSLAQVLGDRPALFMRGHGIVVVARDVEQMLFCSLALEDEARKQVEAATLGAYHCLTHHECEAFEGKQALPDR
ncbi:MAG TPA: class II aldolase/adducin family protein, partial [Beijerinckiaceae bacterium]|nr:class II aldolase/adducin family protein [Beijerinckiaceae bacterium]